MEINIKRNKQEFILLLKKAKRKGTKKLIEYLEFTDFFEAPCSEKFHLHKRGGLCQHSLNVYKALSDLNDSFFVNINKNTIIICSLLHDLCKINLYKKVAFPKNRNEYKKNDEVPLGHSEKSLAIILEFIQLSDLEKMMIRWHMGKYDESFSNKQANLVQATFPETFLMYFADHIATLYLDSLYEYRGKGKFADTNTKV